MVHLYILFQSTYVHKKCINIPTFVSFSAVPDRYVYAIETSLSKPHTSDTDGTSVAFTIIYIEIWVNGTNVMCPQKYVFEN